MNLLFITRKYPPVVGGMEKFSYNFFTYISKLTPAILIALRKSQKYLIFFYLYLFVKVLFINRKHVNIIHFGDALLSPLGVFIKCVKKIPVTVTVHALDVIFPNKLYQLIIPKCLKRLDRIICVSNETMKECIKRGIDPAKCVVIPNGIVKCHSVEPLNNKRILGNLIHREVNNKKIILSVGRLIERKGFHYFLKDIFPKLKVEYPNILYIIVGSGKLKNEIKFLISQLGLKNDVYLLEDVDDLLLNSLYQISDVFVMPNVPVKGDMEGFGIVALEASSAGLPVVASNIEGIKEAIIDNKNGFLVNPYDDKRYIEVILDLLNNDKIRIDFGRQAMEITDNMYKWEKISEIYLKTFNAIVASYNKN